MKGTVSTYDRVTPGNSLENRTIPFITYARSCEHKSHIGSIAQ